jgi:hypothetical protein
MLSERLIEMMMDQPNLPALSANPAYTRRQIIAGSAFGLCSLVIVNAQDATSAKAKTIIATRAIHQEEDFKAGPAGSTRLCLTPSSSARFRAAAQPRFIVKSEVPLPFSLATSWDEIWNWYPINVSSRPGGWFRGPKASIPSPGSNSWKRVPERESRLITPVSRQNWQSIWRAGGSKTIGHPCRNTWLSGITTAADHTAFA